ncbi:hypothetical protein B5F81_07080 [Muribaculum sp. An287]|nr:hypothetical protein B5F81_07080 [Muribaculum sp. An287]
MPEDTNSTLTVGTVFTSSFLQEKTDMAISANTDIFNKVNIFFIVFFFYLNFDCFLLLIFVL